MRVKAKIAEDRRKENGPWTLAAAPLHYKVQLALARFLAIGRGDIRRHIEVPRMAYCDRCMSFLASKNGKQMKLPVLGEAEVDSRRGADRGGWRSALSLVPHRTTAVTRNATAFPLVDWFSNRAAVMPCISIRKTEYDLERRILSVWFVASGKRYEFEGVAVKEMLRTLRGERAPQGFPAEALLRRGRTRGELLAGPTPTPE
ncbi:hypothetical protein NKJ22_23170 [Mesorhizobium sp. M0220]